MATSAARVLPWVLLGVLSACGGGGRSAPHPWFVQSAAVVDYVCFEALTFGIATGDFDGDGSLDVVSTQRRHACPSGVAVPGLLVLGTGDGGLLPAPAVDVPSWNPGPGGLPSDGYDPVVADFDADGLPDLAVRTGTDLAVFRSTGAAAGSSSWQPISIQPGAWGGTTWGQGMVGADVDGDQDVDLVAAHVAGTLTVLFNDGDGGFDMGRSRVIETLSGASDLKSADLNGDGEADVVFLASDGALDSRVVVLYGNGLGDFVGEQAYDVVGEPRTLDLADFDGDGDLDVVVAVKAHDLSAGAPPDAFRGRLVVLERIASSPFPAPFTQEYEVSATIVLAASEDARTVAAGDFDADGDVDIVCGTSEDVPVTIVRALTCVQNVGGGAFGFLGGLNGSARRFRIPGDPLATRLRAGDFDADGRLDLVWLGTHSPDFRDRLRIFRNRSGDD